MARGLDHRIVRISGWAGEWFVDLKAGFSLDGEQHGFGEETKKDIRRTMALVKPCDCDRCRSSLAEGRGK
ncbi:MAG: hypothetical protein ACRYGR_05975 [Janthinobacterium lividum]